MLWRCCKHVCKWHCPTVSIQQSMMKIATKNIFSTCILIPANRKISMSFRTRHSKVCKGLENQIRNWFYQKFSNKYILFFFFFLYCNMQRRGKHVNVKNIPFLYFFIVLSAYFILHLLCKLKNINFCKNVWILRIWWEITEAWLFFASAHSRFLTQFCHLSVNILRFGLLHQGLFLLPCLSYFSSALKKF